MGGFASGFLLLNMIFVKFTHSPIDVHLSSQFSAIARSFWCSYIYISVGYLLNKRTFWAMGYAYVQLQKNCQTLFQVDE